MERKLYDRDENGRFKSKFLTSETKETNTEIQAKKDKVYKINFNETKIKYYLILTVML